MAQLIHVGDVVGDLTVTEYCGVTMDEKRNRRAHFFNVECKCGEKERIVQCRLRGTRPRTCCLKCAAQKRRTQKKLTAKPEKELNIFKLWPAHATDGGFA